MKRVFIHDRETFTQGGFYRYLIVPAAAAQGGGAGFEQCAWPGGLLPARTACSCAESQSMAEIRLCHLYVHSILFFSFSFVSYFSFVFECTLPHDFLNL